MFILLGSYFCAPGRPARRPGTPTEPATALRPRPGAESEGRRVGAAAPRYGGAPRRSAVPSRADGVARFLLVGVVLASACGRGAPELVRRPADPPPALLITNVGVLDVATGTLTRDRDVLVVGDRITPW